MAYWALDPEALVQLPTFTTLLLVSASDAKQRRPSHRVTFSMGHARASRKSPHDAPLETLNRRLSRPISGNPEITRDKKKEEVKWRPALTAFIFIVS